MGGGPDLHSEEPETQGAGQAGTGQSQTRLRSRNTEDSGAKKVKIIQNQSVISDKHNICETLRNC